MGIWDYINSGKETVKRYTPGPVKSVCNGTYYYSAAAVKMIDDAVRVDGVQKLGQFIPDDEGRAKIVDFSYKFVKNASAYGVKEAATFFIPGGKAVAEIYSKTAREIEIESRNKQHKSCVEENKQDKLCIEEIVAKPSNNNTTGSGSGDLRLLDRAEMVESREQLKLGSEIRVQVGSFAHQTPEDVLRVFMMKEFMGTRYLDNLLVPDHGKQKKV